MTETRDRRTAKIYAVEGSIDRPVDQLEDGASAMVEVQFNPTSLKVSLANALKENERSGNTRAAQFVDKSSSTLTVELIFDTTDQFVMEDGGGERSQETDQRQDVRLLTGAIASTFMRPNAGSDSGDEEQAPHRCLFAWGTFAFVGIMESFDETLEFFSPEGTPLRATVAIKISESRYQFRSAEAQSAQRDTPTMSPASESMNDASWRDAALFNGVESPRAPGSDSLADPGQGPGSGLGMGGGMGGGLGMGMSGGISGSIGAGVGGGLGFGGGMSGGIGGGIGMSGGVGIGGSLSAGSVIGGSASLGGGTSVGISGPAFKFGASASIGTGIPGAFSLDTKSTGGLTAGSILAAGKSQASFGAGMSGSMGASGSLGLSGSGSAQASASLGFD